MGVENYHVVELVGEGSFGKVLFKGGSILDRKLSSVILVLHVGCPPTQLFRSIKGFGQLYSTDRHG